MSLHQLLDETIVEPAPPAPSLDALIARARRTQHRRRLGAVCSAAAAVLVVAGLAVLIPDPASPPEPADTALAAADPARKRLDNAVLAAVAAEAADVQWLPVRRGGEVAGWFSSWVDDKSAQRPVYLGHGLVRSRGLVGTVEVNVGLLQAPPFGECPRPDQVGVVCRNETGPYGEQVGIREYAFAVGPAQFENAVYVYRADGTGVTVSTRNQAGASENDVATGKPTPLTIEQVRAIALNPALTLLVETQAGDRLVGAMALALRRAFPTEHLEGFSAHGDLTLYSGYVEVLRGDRRLSVYIHLGGRGRLPIQCSDCAISVQGVRGVWGVTEVVSTEPPVVQHKVKVEKLAGDEVFVLMRGPSTAFTREDVINLALDPALTLYV
jgi:hypothetical protein